MRLESARPSTLFLALTLCVFPAVLQAGATDSLLFSTRNQSMWGTGAGATIDPISQFYGWEWNETGGFSTDFGIVNGSLSGTSSGKVGLQLDFGFGSGLVDADVPIESTLNFTYADFVPGSSMNLIKTSALTLDSMIGSNGASFQTQFPFLEFRTALIYETALTIKAAGCADAFLVSGCGNGSYSFDSTTLPLPDEINPATGKGITLASLNYQNDGKLEVLPALQTISTALVDTRETVKEIDKNLDELNRINPNPMPRQKSEAVLDPLIKINDQPLVEATASLPQIVTTLDSVTTDSLKTTRVSDDWLDLDIDVDQILFNLGAFPIPGGINTTIGTGALSATLDATLFDFKLQPQLTLAQQFELLPELEMDLTFNKAVTVYDATGTTILQDGMGNDLIGVTTLSGITTDHPGFRLEYDETGDPFEIIPNFNLLADLVTDTDLGFDLNFLVKALGARVTLKVLGFDSGSFGFDPILDEIIDLEKLLQDGGLLPPNGFGAIDFWDDMFALEGFQSIQGDAITFDTSDATFLGTVDSPGGALWNTAGNWRDGIIGDGGNSVLIDSSVMGAVPYQSITVNEDTNDGVFNVGNISIGEDILLFVNNGGVLKQDFGANSTAFANAGTIVVIGDLEVAAKLTGGGRIDILPSGTLTANTANGLDLQGQTIRGGGNVIVANKFDVDGQSSIGASNARTMNLMVENVGSTTNHSGNSIFAQDGSTLNWASTSASNVYTVDNAKTAPGDSSIIAEGVIRATGGSVINLSHEQTGLGFKTFRIDGGRLETDANSFIQAQGTLFLDGSSSTLTTSANLGDPNGAAPIPNLALKTFAINDGEIFATNVIVGDPDPALFQNSPSNTLGGTGRLNLTGGTVQVAANTGIRPELENGADHQIVGKGTIGNPSAAVLFSMRNLGLIAAGPVDQPPNPELRIALGSGSGIVFDNDGTLQAGRLVPGGGIPYQGDLVLDEGSYDLADGTIHAFFGDVVLTNAATTVNGASTAGPGGTWRAGNFNGDNYDIILENPAVQWSQLNNTGTLDNAEIILEGNAADFFLGASRLESKFRNIFTNGKLTLIDKNFDLDAGSGPVNTYINGVLELAEGARFATGTAVPLGGDAFQTGSTIVDLDGVIQGSGIVTSNVQNRGTIKVEGYEFASIIGQDVPKSLTIIGDLAPFDLLGGGAGTFEIAGGARMSLITGQCDTSPTGCPFPERLITAATINGAQILISSDDVQVDDSTLFVRTTPVSNETNIIQFANNSRVELDGVRTKFYSGEGAGLQLLEATLEEVNDSEFVLANGRVFDSTTASVFFSNNALLELNDAGTTFLSPRIDIYEGAEAQLRGGTLDVDLVQLASGGTIRGHGLINVESILDFREVGTFIASENDELEIRNSTIEPFGGAFIPGAARLIAAVTQEPGMREVGSILRLTDTTVRGMNVLVEAGTEVGAALVGNGIFENTIITNDSTIRVDPVPGGTRTAAVRAFSQLLNNNEVLVTDATLNLETANVDNAANAVIEVVDTNSLDGVNPELRLSNNTTIDGGAIRLITAPGITGALANTTGLDSEDFVQIEGETLTPVDGVLETLTTTSRASLRGEGTLTNVDLFVGRYSWLGADVAGKTLTVDIGTNGSVVNEGSMFAFGGGILELTAPTATQGVIDGSGEIKAFDNSVVNIQNIELNGGSFATQGSGRIIDIGSSTFTNFSNAGQFEVSANGDVTLAGYVNNVGGTITVENFGVLTLTEGPQGIAIEPGTGNVIPDGMPQPAIIDGGQLVMNGGTINFSGISSFLVNDVVWTMNAGSVFVPTTVIGAGSQLSGAGVFNGGENDGMVIAGSGLSFVGGLINRGTIQTNLPVGSINTDLTNESTGSVIAGLDKQIALFGAAHSNAGTIQSTDNGNVAIVGTAGIGTLDNTGTISATGSQVANARISLANMNLINSGNVNLNGGLLSLQDGMTNNAQGAVNISGNGAEVSGDIHNLGQIIVSGASSATFVDFGSFDSQLVNDGEFRVSTGSMATLFVDVTGAGSYTGQGTKFFEAGFSPGSSPGLVTAEGDSMFGAGASIEMEIAGLELGESYDHYRVDGKLALGGTLNVKLLDGFTPDEGDEFDLFDALEFAGMFASLNFDDAALASGLRWNFSQLNSTGTLSVSAVPLPAGVWLMLSALVGLAAMRRRRVA